tara:strand:- start:2007 stop:2261 length:255 start_codon:yes stop_codon:yes gene_type:complete
MLNLKSAQSLSDSFYNRSNVKNGMLRTIAGSATPIITDVLNQKFNVSSASTRMREIEIETGIRFNRTYVTTSAGKGKPSVAYSL